MHGSLRALEDHQGEQPDRGTDIRGSCRDHHRHARTDLAQSKFRAPMACRSRDLRLSEHRKAIRVGSDTGPRYGDSAVAPERETRDNSMPALAYPEVTDYITGTRTGRRVVLALKLALKYSLLTATWSAEMRKATSAKTDMNSTMRTLLYHFFSRDASL